MPMPDGVIEKQRATQAVDSTLVNTSGDRFKYAGVMRREDVPVRASPTLEIEWLAFSLSKAEADYDSAPSKVAATWLRRLRLRKNLKDKFWSDTWPYYMENRLSLELKAAGPVPAKKGGRVVKSDEAVQASIEKMSGKKSLGA